jgi:hypothetical protein
MVIFMGHGSRARRLNRARDSRPNMAILALSAYEFDNSTAITDEILAMSRLAKWSDENEFSSGMSLSQRAI